jgi:endonuclease YncB( thermonuclease family)
MLTRAAMKIRIYFGLACIALICFVPICFGSEYQVVDVIAGDIIKVHHENTAIEIRLAAIDSPEIGQPWGERAKEFTRQLVLNKKVAVLPIGIDRRGRIIAWVYIDDIDLNKALLRAGLAWHDRRQSQESLLTALEMEARVAKKGLWSEPDAIPPWEWRERQKV